MLDSDFDINGRMFLKGEGRMPTGGNGISWHVLQV